jgi:hypothetical protein
MNDDPSATDPNDDLLRRLSSLAPLAPHVDLALLRYEQGVAAGRAAALAEFERSRASGLAVDASTRERSSDEDELPRNGAAAARQTSTLPHRSDSARPYLARTERRWFESPAWPSVSALLLVALIGSFAIPRGTTILTGDRTLPPPASSGGAVAGSTSPPSSDDAADLGPKLDRPPSEPSSSGAFDRLAVFDPPLGAPPVERFTGLNGQTLGNWRGWFDPASLSLEMRLRLGLGQEGAWEALERREARPLEKSGEAIDVLPKIERPRAFGSEQGSEAAEGETRRTNFNWGDWL